VGVAATGQLSGLGLSLGLWCCRAGHDPDGGCALRPQQWFKMSGAQRIWARFEAGKLAIWLFFDQNPLDIFQHETIHWVMKTVLFEGDTLNEVWPNRKSWSSRGSGQLRCTEGGRTSRYGLTICNKTNEKKKRRRFWRLSFLSVMVFSSATGWRKFLVCVALYKSGGASACFKADQLLVSPGIRGLVKCPLANRGYRRHVAGRTSRTVEFS